MPRLTRSESQALTRQRLIEAMTALVVERGYRGASLDEICDRAGYSRGAFYSQFKSRDELMLACLEKHLDQEIRNIDQLVIENATLQEIPERIARYYAAGGDRVQWVVLQIEFQLYAARKEEFAKQFEQSIRAFRERVAKLVEHSFPPGTNLPISWIEMASVLLSISYGMNLQRASDTRLSTKAIAWGLSNLATQAIEQAQTAARRIGSSNAP
jgi:AcrR family transcriptional regulator